MAQKKLLFCVIFLPEYLVSIEKSCNFAVSKGTEIRPKAKSKPKTDTLPCGVMVAHRILVPFVRVRVFPRQHLKSRLINRLVAIFLLCPGGIDHLLLTYLSPHLSGPTPIRSTPST